MNVAGWPGAAGAAPAVGGAARLQGVNLGGWLVAGATPAHLAGFIDEGDFARLASWCFSHVRLPVDAALLDSAAGWAALDAALEACDRRHLGCVLALRLEPAAQADLFRDEAGWRPFAARWETIARRYADRPRALAYDLLDRPSPPDDTPPEVLAALGAARPAPAAARRPSPPGATAGRAWSALATRLTHAIRAIDERRPLVVQAHQGASAAAFAQLRPTRDSSTYYSLHCFEPAAFALQGSGASSRGPGSPVTYPGIIDGERWDRARLEQWLEPALGFRRVYGAPVYVGAFGASAAAPRQAQLTWVRSFLALCRAHALGWAYWTYKDDLFGLVCVTEPGPHRPQYRNPYRLDYDLLGMLQSEA